MLILRTTNYFLSDYPISCLKIYILLIQHHNIYDGYNYQDILPFLDIDNSSDYHKASENAIMTCKFIATVLKYAFPPTVSADINDVTRIVDMMVFIPRLFV